VLGLGKMSAPRAIIAGDGTLLVQTESTILGWTEK